jgi:hypothetical protein
MIRERIGSKFGVAQWISLTGLLALGCQPPSGEESTTKIAPTSQSAVPAPGAPSKLPIQKKAMAAVSGSTVPAGVEVAGGSRIRVDSSSGDVYALNAYGGATDGGQVLLWQNCPKDNPDCMWYLRSGMIISARNTALAIRPRQSNMQYSDLILDSKCTAETPECLWVWTRGMLQNGANRDFVINARDGAVQTGTLVIDNTCSDANLNCTFTIENARLSLGADFRTGLYAGNSPMSGNSVFLSSIWPCPMSDDRCTWTLQRGRIHSDYDSSLALDSLISIDEYSVWLNGQCGDSPTCYWTYDGRVIVNDPPVQGMYESTQTTQLALVPRGGPLTDLTGTLTSMRLGATAAEGPARMECANSTPSNPACDRGYLCETNSKALEPGQVTNDFCPAECSLLGTNPNPACFFEVGSPQPIVWSGSPAPRAKWSILMLHYTDGAYSSESFWDQGRMGFGGSTQDVNILVYVDTPIVYGAWLGPLYRGRGTFLRVNRNASPTILQELGEVDMGDPGKLRDFSNLAATYFPADNYAVIGYDHGAGWGGFGGDADAGNGSGGHGISIPNDATDGGSYGSYGQMLSNMNTLFGKKVGVIAFDSCFNGMWEVATASAPYVQYMVGSEAGMGVLRYGKFIPQLAANPSMTPAELATAITSTFPYEAPRAQTMAATDLSRTGIVTSAVNAFAHALRDPIYYDCVEQARLQARCVPDMEHCAEYSDLYYLADVIGSSCNSQSIADLAIAVKQAVADGPFHAVIATNSPADPDNPRGLAINMPARCASVDPNYYPDLNYQVAKGSIWSLQTEWDDFLRGFAPPAAELELPAPALMVTPGSGGTSATLTWSMPPAPDGLAYEGVNYAVWRGTSPGAEDVVVAPYPPTTPYTSTTFTDTGLNPNQPYYYTVLAMNCRLSPVSNEVSVGTPTPVYRINTGSTSAVSPFTADQYGSGGTMNTVSNTITIGSEIANPAPMAVYQSERYGTSTYTVPNLTPGRQYTVRLHFAELYWTAANKRLFNVLINGTTVLSNFDVYAATGARYKALVREFTATANSSGQIVINFNTVTNNATIGGIEIIASSPNIPPIVVTPPFAAPRPVTGTTTSLAVLGADDGGESNLTYTWATTGTPPATVTFSANGTNAAKSTTATFTAAGTYTLQVTVTDQPGLTATSSVTVTVNQTLTSIVVSPSSASVKTSATHQFTATARDQFASNLTTQPAFTWTVSGGGSISTGGLFTAGTTAGGPYTVTAKSGTVSGTASVTVTSVGTNPCATLCSNPVVFTIASYQSGNLGTGATCHQTTASLAGGNCSNIGSRTLKVNNTTMNCNSWTLPAKRNGGYCIQVTAGTPNYTSFATW